MLVSFSVANFRSFGEEVTLNMVASNKITGKESHRVPIGNTGKSLVRSAVLYGANAAGKSNLVKAMAFARDWIRGRRDIGPLATPFTFDTRFADLPSSFEFRMLIDGRVFTYGFDIKANEIISEWLSVLDGEEEVNVFSRNESGDISTGTISDNLFPLDQLLKSVLPRLAALPIKRGYLFLNHIRQFSNSVVGKTLHSVIRWFQELEVYSVDHKHRGIINRLCLDDQFAEFCSGFLSQVGTGVSRVRVDNRERDAGQFEQEVSAIFFKEEDNEIPVRYKSDDSEVVFLREKPGRVIERKLVAEHTPSSHEVHCLPFGQESDGTKSLLSLLPILSNPTNKTRVIVIDELDRSLHPLLCWEFLRFFSETAPGAAKQLIVTTHEAHLLDQELLRRDEYWFVEKDEKQQSQLVPLSDFNIRNDLQLRKGYLQGRFGGIPIIGGLQALEALLAPQSSDSKTREQANATQEASA